MLRAAVLAACLLAGPTLASEEHLRMYHADAQSDAWMRSLIRPDVGTTCCSLNDCQPTDAEWRDGQWVAIIRGKWTPIPPEKIVASPLSIDGEAWVCSGDNGTIY